MASSDRADMAALCNVGHHSPECPHQPQVRADFILDNPYADPDRDAAVMARAYLKASADLDRLRALATLGASLQHLHGLGILERHHGTLDECTTQRCVDARAALGDRDATPWHGMECTAPDCRKVAGHSGRHFPVPGDGTPDSLRGGRAAEEGHQPDFVQRDPMRDPAAIARRRDAATRAAVERRAAETMTPKEAAAEHNHVVDGFFVEGCPACPSPEDALMTMHYGRRTMTPEDRVP